MRFSEVVLVIFALMILKVLFDTIVAHPLMAVSIVLIISLAIYLLFKWFDYEEKRDMAIRRANDEKSRLMKDREEVGRQALEQEATQIAEQLIADTKKQLKEIVEEIEDIAGNLYFELRNISSDILSEVAKDCRFISCPRCRQVDNVIFKGFDRNSLKLKMECGDCEKRYIAEISKSADPKLLSTLMNDHVDAYLSMRPSLIKKLAQKDALLDRIDRSDWVEFDISTKYDDILYELEENVEYYEWHSDGLFLDIDYSKYIGELIPISSIVLLEIMDKLHETGCARALGSEKFTYLDEFESGDIDVDAISFSRENGDIFHVSMDELEVSINRIISNVKLFDGDHSKIHKSLNDEYNSEAIIALLRLLPPESYTTGYEK